MPPPKSTSPTLSLRAAVLAALDKPTDAQLTLADMENLTELNAQNAGISDLTGLQHATNLTELKLGGNQLSDISALSGLTQSDKPCQTLSSNQLSDISVLSGLTNLTNLTLSRNQTILGLGFNQLSDISALSGLTHLTGLALGKQPAIRYLLPVWLNTADNTAA